MKWFQINDDICDPITDKMIWDTVLHYSDSDSDSQNCTNMEKILDNIPSLPKLSSWLPVKTIEEDTFIAIPTYIDNNGFLYLHSKTQSITFLKFLKNIPINFIIKNNFSNLIIYFKYIIIYLHYVFFL